MKGIGLIEAIFVISGIETRIALRLSMISAKPIADPLCLDMRWRLVHVIGLDPFSDLPVLMPDQNLFLRYRFDAAAPASV